MVYVLGWCVVCEWNNYHEVTLAYINLLIHIYRVDVKLVVLNITSVVSSCYLLNIDCIRYSTFSWWLSYDVSSANPVVSDRRRASQIFFCKFGLSPSLALGFEQILGPQKWAKFFMGLNLQRSMGLGSGLGLLQPGPRTSLITMYKMANMMERLNWNDSCKFSDWMVLSQSFGN